MPVFKLFFKIIKANFSRFLVSLFVFILLATLIYQTTSEQNDSQFQLADPQITIFDNDHSSKASQTLIHFLSQRAEIVEIENTPEAISDAFFDRKINYALTIPEGFNESLLDTSQSVIPLQKESYNSLMDEIRIDSLIESFMVNAILLVDNLPQDVDQKNYDQVFSQLERNLNFEIEILLGSQTKESSKTMYLGLLFLPMILYFIMMNFINNFGYVELAMRQESVIKRERNSLLKESSRLTETILATTCYTIGFWIVLILLAYLFYGGEVLASQRAFYFLLSSFIATLGIQAMAYFIAVIAPNRGLIDFLGNFFSLLIAFGSGLFVDLDLIPNELQFVSSFATPIWSVKANQIIAETTNFSQGAMIDYWRMIGIELLITLAYWSLALLIKKKAQETNYIITT
ncbi:ABC transporter permease [Facklamia miroungae]|uniref:ABC-2 family transporter protein n=1 Tax=Facklamia miroungae TaxID=120956 RepID=A0A1G7QVD7_9LACT|nr:ABC transporter permease [Facklamia miroungae]NKZ29053.1 ABC transporter permease [Facklamia miroungae]SDG01630.1 ABC-2 family transporter protein [Facklamia miroungae]